MAAVGDEVRGVESPCVLLGLWLCNILQQQLQQQRKQQQQKQEPGYARAGGRSATLSQISCGSQFHVLKPCCLADQQDKLLLLFGVVA